MNPSSDSAKLLAFHPALAVVNVAVGAIAITCIALGQAAPAAIAAGLWLVLSLVLLAVTFRRWRPLPAMESVSGVPVCLSDLAEVIWCADGHSGRLTYISPNCHRVFGFSAEKLLSRADLWLSRIHGADRPFVAREIESLKTGQTVHYVYRIGGKDKEPRWVSETLTPTRDSLGRLVQIRGISEDITERKQLEIQLIQSRRLEAVGHLSRGVAHDFNNLLTIISGNTELIEASLDDREAVLQYLFDLRRATEQSSSMVQGLLSFGRTWAAEPRPFDLNQLLSDTMRVVRRAMGDNLSIQIEPDDSLENVLLDPALLQQALLNLCLTARSTMSAGGTLTFRTGDVALSEDEAALRPEVHAGRYARLSLEAAHTTDAGEIPATCFSTEVVDPENGIGLATVYRIIQDHHGWVDLKPPQGNSELINLYLPFEETIVQADQTASQDISRGGELLLVLEEVDMIASFITTIMEMRGYLVITARQAGAAWEMFEARRNEFAAAILNIGAPGGSGLEFARRLRGARPDLPLILTSANALQETDPLMNDDRVTLLQKPFRADHLGHVVRTLIDARLQHAG